MNLHFFANLSTITINGEVLSFLSFLLQKDSKKENESDSWKEKLGS